ncbi:MAG TPA: hypothetical protein VIE39_03175 [Thermoanaerobaculia bacterium]|jgi:hypothetical protein
MGRGRNPAGRGGRGRLRAAGPRRPIRRPADLELLTEPEAPLSPARIFLLSPASLTGKRARILLRPEARFDLARRLRTRPGAPLSEVFTFLSGLYFRGKIAYARAFAAPPAGVSGIWIITPNEGLLPAETPVTRERLERFAGVDIDPGEPRYRRPLEQDARRLAGAVAPGTEFVLLGSVASGKYIEPLLGILVPLLFPPDFTGRGDMSRGGLMLRHVRENRELRYGSVQEFPRHGPRPPRLTRRGFHPTTGPASPRAPGER